MSANISFDQIALKIHASNKRQVLQILAARIAEYANENANDIHEILRESERSMSSAIGGSVAVPAITLPHLKHPVAIMILLSNPVDFDAPDHLPVDIIFALASNENDGGLHLQRLSNLSRMARNDDFVSNLRGAENIETAQAILDGLTDLRKAA